MMSFASRHFFHTKKQVVEEREKSEEVHQRTTVRALPWALSGTKGGLATKIVLDAQIHRQPPGRQAAILPHGPPSDSALVAPFMHPSGSIFRHV